MNILAHINSDVYEKRYIKIMRCRYKLEINVISRFQRFELKLYFFICFFFKRLTCLVYVANWTSLSYMIYDSSFNKFSLNHSTFILGPMVWYQKFEYAVSHWLQKATEHVIGCVLCSPGCFSLFRGSAVLADNVLKTYTRQATEAEHHIQYDQGKLILVTIGP